MAALITLLRIQVQNCHSDVCLCKSVNAKCCWDRPKGLSCFSGTEQVGGMEPRMKAQRLGVGIGLALELKLKCTRVTFSQYFVDFSSRSPLRGNQGRVVANKSHLIVVAAGSSGNIVEWLHLNRIKVPEQM